MNRIRAFIAVNLPVAVTSKVTEVQTELRQRARQANMSVGWVPPTHMHVTLKFLAEIPEESVWAVRDLLKDKLATRSALPVVVKGTGAFPTRSKPRVIWVGLQSEGDALTALAKEVDLWLTEIGFSPETRAFHPHLTLGRVKQGGSDLLEGLEEVELGTCMISEVVLYQSVLQRQGAEYTPLARIALANPLRAMGTGSITPSVE
jgi:RNA 2',3'-cyclic 3'-phosphodiesterase